jgi:putative GTP pyrophosphokinase
MTPSRSRVRKAGDALRASRATPEDQEVIHTWRALHERVLLDWQVLSEDDFFADFHVSGSRLKRMESIEHKISRSSIGLERMQDIAGLRLVFRDRSDLEWYIKILREAFSDGQGPKGFDLSHYSLVKEFDYIDSPKANGYRGVHLIFEHKRDVSDRQAYGRLCIEVQLRTTAHHAWATAVEVTDNEWNTGLKVNQADVQYVRFFQAAGDLIAARLGEPLADETTGGAELVARFNDANETAGGLLAKLDGVRTIGWFLNKMQKRMPVDKMNFVFRQFRDNAGHLSTEIRQYVSLSEASEIYSRLEEEFPRDNVVLTSAKTVKDVMETYKNYFQDAGDFVRLVESGIQVLKSRAGFIQPL